MKHLKLYENNNQDEFWLVVVEYTDYPDSNYQELFKNSESADNFIIVKVNEHRQEIAERKGKEFTEKDIFLTILEADEWLDNSWDIKIYSIRMKCNDKFELPEEYKVIADTRKYNI